MFSNVEAFYRPANVREAVQLLQRGRGRARIVAGCKDVNAQDDTSVRFLIDLSHAGLSYIRRRGANWVIGAATTIADIAHSSDIRALAGGILPRAAATCGSVQLRNVATVGGNLGVDSPAADLATPLLALDAVAVVANATGRHKMRLAAYLALSGNRQPVDSLLAEIAFPDPAPAAHSGWYFQKFARTAVDVAIVNVAAGLRFDSRGRVQAARIVLGAVTPVPVHATGTEELLTGRSLDHALLAEAAESVVREIDPITDVRASADYRRELCRVLTRRALEACAAQRGCSL
jgi:CO/xanthine dehydrogenase FAD-binding subunit